MSLVLDSAAQDLLFREARTASIFTDEPVTDEQIQAIFELVKWGPTAVNSQPLRVVLVRSAEARERLVSHLNDGNKAKTAAAPLTAILAYNSEWTEDLPEVFPHVPDAKHWFPSEEARHGGGTLSGAIQIGYFIVGIRAAGLAAGPMNGFDAEGINKEFFADGQNKVLAVVNIGQPDEGAFFPRNPRFEFDRVFTTV